MQYFDDVGYCRTHFLPELRRALGFHSPPVIDWPRFENFTRKVLAFCASREPDEKARGLEDKDRRRHETRVACGGLKQARWHKPVGKRADEIKLEFKLYKAAQIERIIRSERQIKLPRDARRVVSFIKKRPLFRG